MDIDKLMHYNICYYTVRYIPQPFKPFIAGIVNFIMSIMKEEIWDGILGLGCYEEADKEMNQQGLYDALHNKPNRYKDGDK